MNKLPASATQLENWPYVVCVCLGIAAKMVEEQTHQLCTTSLIGACASHSCMSGMDFNALELQCLETLNWQLLVVPPLL